MMSNETVANEDEKRKHLWLNLGLLNLEWGREKTEEDKCRYTEERHMMYRKLYLYAIAAASHSLWNQMRYKLIEEEKWAV